METQDNQVAIINNSIEIFKTAPQILKANQETTQGALRVGNEIMQQWLGAWAIESEDERLLALSDADERSNNYLVRCGNALKNQKETRAAITQMMDEFKKMFTGAENDIDKTKPNTVPALVQGNRDAYAKTSFEIAERKRKEVELDAAKKKEAIELKATVENRVFEYFNDHLIQ